jgi:hypothetical protein
MVGSNKVLNLMVGASNNQSLPSLSTSFLMSVIPALDLTLHLLVRTARQS